MFNIPLHYRILMVIRQVLIIKQRDCKDFIQEILHVIVIEQPGVIVNNFAVWFEEHHAAPVIGIASLRHEALLAFRVAQTY